MRPHYIDTESWVRLSYPRRLAIHRAETELAERAAGRAHEASSGGGAGSASPGGVAACTDSPSVHEAAAADLAEATPRRAQGAHPVIIEFCCSPDSAVGNITHIGKPGGAVPACTVHRITLDNDVTTSAGAAYALQIARESPGALLLSSLPCTAGCP